jgi:hypothetical protein
MTCLSNYILHKVWNCSLSGIQAWVSAAKDNSSVTTFGDFLLQKIVTHVHNTSEILEIESSFFFFKTWILFPLLQIETKVSDVVM